MPINGSLTDDNNLVFPVEVYGHSRNWKIPVNAILDTGFTGFLDLPLEFCLKAGLVLATTTTYVLANGQSVPVLLCYGTVVIDKNEIVGLVSINMSSRTTLLGVDFLKKLGMKFEADPKARIVRFV